MGIFGALTTAVSGLRAQSFALENISGNIANSQTTAFKRSDTNFTDLIKDAVANKQLSGSVGATTRATNSVQGDIQAANNTTYMAINGTGFFVVSEATGYIDGKPVFGGTDLYTRRGDFEVDKDGYLVNGAGYYLQALPVDRLTGNIAGSVPQVIKLSNDVLPARRSTTVEYRGNLPSYPLTSDAKPDLYGTELINGAAYASDPRTATTAWLSATTTGTGLTFPGDLAGAGPVTDGNTLTLRIGSGPVKTFTIGTGGAPEINSLDDLVFAINGDADLVGLVASNEGGQLKLAAQSQNADFTVGGTAATELGLTAGMFDRTMGTGTGVVLAEDDLLFTAQSIWGGAITLYDTQGSPVNVQIRWAKTNSSTSGGQDTWNMFYMSNSNAVGSQVKWTNIGTDYTFNANGQLQPAFHSITIPNLTVNNVNLGDITLSHGTMGITQFADVNGVTNLTALSQDGYPIGEVVRLSIGDNGRITAFYSNNQVADIGEIPMVYFNGENQLKRLDGGAYAATFESGPPIPGAPGAIVGGSLEGANADIADEFTKLIVTQQAYSANTRIISTSNEMLKDALNMIR